MNIVEDNNIGYTLIEAIDNRNKSSHEYCDEEDLKEYISDIINEYYPAMMYVCLKLKVE